MLRDQEGAGGGSGRLGAIRPGDTGDIFASSGMRDEPESGFIMNSQGQMEWGRLGPARDSEHGSEGDEEENLMLVLQKLLKKNLPRLVGGWMRLCSRENVQ